MAYRCVLVLAILMLLPALVLADGKAFSGRADGPNWRPLKEHDQAAAIHHANGRQSMHITVNIQLDDNAKGFWLFPVRGTPDQVKLDLVDTMPTFMGVAPLAQARDTVMTASLMMKSSQLWAGGIFLPSLGRAREAASRHHGAFAFDAIHKWGLRAEKVTAPDIDSLAALLKDRNANVQSADLRSFEPYLDGKHTLITVTIASLDEVKKEFGDKTPSQIDRWPRVWVDFPTANAFYPMRASFHRPAYQMPVTLHLHHWYHAVGPTYPETTTHYFNGWRRDSLEAETSQNLQYTRVRLTPNTDDLTHDLEFAPGAPPAITRAAFVANITNQHPWASLVFLLLFFLGLSAATGALISKLMREDVRTGAKAGLFNILTIIVVFIAARPLKRRWLFTLNFTLAFTALIWLLEQGVLLLL